MSRVDVHPEELIDAARRGDLDPAGRHRLDAHLEHCTACRAELAVGSDFAAAATPKDGDDVLIAGIVTGALISAGLPAAATGAATGSAVSAGSAVGKGMLLKVAGAALGAGVLGGAAVALWMTGAFDGEPVPPVEPEERPAVVTPAEPELDVAGPTAADPVPPAADTLEPEPEPEPEAQPQPTAAPEPTPEPADTATRPRAPARPERAEPSLGAAELLERANTARRQGDYAQALRWYRTLQRNHPSSRETVVSRVTLGRLYLDGLGEPARALEQFERYLGEHPGGVLAEEARVGRALALMRLGRRAEERAAWQELLRRHPDSLHAERARSRLE